MNCTECDILLHALLDGELDAGHAREVEAHARSCAACGPKLAAFAALRRQMKNALLREPAPQRLRDRIGTALPPGAAAGTSRLSRRGFFGGVAAGTAVSGALAATVMLTMLRDDRARRIADEVVSAHIRSLQAGHLMDVETGDQHTVKPWFNGRLDVAPPVADLTAQGFTLLGGRRAGAAAAVQGYNVRHWSEGGLDFWAVSDLDAEELGEFGRKFAATVRAPT